MVHVRCPAVLARLQWVVEHHGEAAFDATLAAMKPEHAAAIRAAFEPSQWIAFDAFLGLCEAIDARYGKGHTVLFAINPIWRGETIGSYALVFNTILNFDHLTP